MVLSTIVLAYYQFIKSSVGNRMCDMEKLSHEHMSLFPYGSSRGIAYFSCEVDANIPAFFDILVSIPLHSIETAHNEDTFINWLLNK